MAYLDDIKRFIFDWNNENPIDFWWRTRYNVPFGSPLHLDMDMIDMRVSYEEIEMYKRVEKELERRRDEAENNLLGIGDDKSPVKKVISMSTEEIRDEFDNLDLSKFVENPNK